jgi:excisionase family DNA binding protein
MDMCTNSLCITSGDGIKEKNGMDENTEQDSAIYRSVDALARELGISRQKAYTSLRTGKIPSIRLGKRFIIPRAAIAEWLRTAGGSPSRARVN